MSLDQHPSFSLPADTTRPSTDHSRRQSNTPPPHLPPKSNPNRNSSALDAEEAVEGADRQKQGEGYLQKAEAKEGKYSHKLDEQEARDQARFRLHDPGYTVYPKQRHPSFHRQQRQKELFDGQEKHHHHHHQHHRHHSVTGESMSSSRSSSPSSIRPRSPPATMHTLPKLAPPNTPRPLLTPLASNVSGKSGAGASQKCSCQTSPSSPPGSPGGNGNAGAKLRRSDTSKAWTNVAPLQPHSFESRFTLDFYLSLTASLCLLGLVVFTFWAQATEYVVPVSALTRPIVNASNLSALIAAVGVLISPAFANVLTVLGKRWIYTRIKHKQPITLGEWSAISSMGSLGTIPHSYRIGFGLFPLALAIYWIIGPAISGAINPSLSDVTENTFVNTARISGSLGRDYAASMVSCFSAPFALCPAFLNGPSISTAMFSGGWGTSGYYVNGYLQNTIEGVAGQPGIWKAPDHVSRDHLNDVDQIISINACMPTLVPQVTCTISKDPSSVITNATIIDFDTGCGYRDSSRFNYSTQVLSYGCSGDGEADVYRTSWIVAGEFAATRAGAGSVVRADCQIRAAEQDVTIKYMRQDRSFNRFTSCGNPTYLNRTEIRPMAGSIVWLLADSQIGDGINLFTPMLTDAIAKNNVTRFELLYTAGMNAAAGIVYDSFSFAGPTNGSDTSRFPLVPAHITYRAYAWKSGWKGWVWGGLLSAGLSMAITATIIGLRPRTRYNPADFASTVFIALNSKDLAPPPNTSTGAVPAGVMKSTLQYGPGPNGDDLQFMLELPEKPKKLHRYGTKVRQ